MSKVFSAFYILIMAGTLVAALGPSVYQSLTRTEDGDSSNGGPHFQDYFENSTVPRFFSFMWVGQNFMIPSGVLWVNVIFDWSTDELEATMKINDNDFNATDSIHLAFGENRSFPKPYPKQLGAYLLFATNLTVSPGIAYLDKYGMVHTLRSPDHGVSSYHTCDYEDGVYTFYFHIPKSSVEFPLKVHLGWYDDVAYPPATVLWDHFVFVQFGV